MGQFFVEYWHFDYCFHGSFGVKLYQVKTLATHEDLSYYKSLYYKPKQRKKVNFTRSHKKSHYGLIFWKVLDRIFSNGKMVFAKLKNLFAKLIFFPPNFFLLRKISLFQNSKKKVLAGKKINLAKKVYPY